MYRPPDIETLEDFSQYYRGAYIGWQPADLPAPIPAYVADVSPGGVHVTFEGRKDRIVEFQDVMAFAQFGAPQYGSAEAGPFAFYVSRKAERTPRRGHRAGALQSFHFIEESREVAGTTSWDYMNFLFNPRYRGLMESFNLLDTGQRMGCSLSRHFSAVNIPGFNVPALFYKTRHIGYIPTTTRIELEEKDHIQLVSSVFPHITVT